MNDKLIEDINISFDIKDHRELTPYIYFTEGSILQETQDSYSSNYTKDFHHYPWVNQIFENIKTEIYSDKYYGDDQDELLNHEKHSINEIIDSLRIGNPTSVEDQFCHLPAIISSQQNNSQYFLHLLKKKLIRDLRQMPISTAQFPRFVNQDLNNFHVLQDLDLEIDDSEEKKEIEKRQKDEEKMKSIILPNTSNESQEPTQSINYNFENLTEFYEILRQYKKPFSFRPSFILFCIQKFDSFLNSLIDQSDTTNQNSKEEKSESYDRKHFNYFLNIDSKNLTNDEKQTKLNYYHLVLKIKMRLYMMIHKTNEFMCLLIETIILENDQNILEQIISETLPDTKRRSKMVKNISPSEIIDFSFSHDERNDFILTTDGVFKATESSIEKVEFDALKKFTDSNSKIAFSNDILYLVSNESKQIYRKLIHSDKKEEKVTPPKNYNPKKNEENKEEKKMTAKKMREKERKERKRLGRLARKEGEKEEINTEPISIDLSNSPIISIGAFNNYVRIVQKKNSNTLILNNIDLSPNNRLNFDIDEAFTSQIIDKPVTQTQFEIDTQSKKEIQSVCFSEDKIFILFKDSTIEQWLIYKDGKAEMMNQLISPYIISPNSMVKFDNDSFFYVLESISEKAVSVNKFHLPYTKYFVRSENSVFLKYPYLQKLSDIVDNCTHLVINREVTKNYTSEEYTITKDTQHDSDEEKEKKRKNIFKKIINPFEFSVSPCEMSFVVQSISSLSCHIDYIKELIEKIKDEELKRFFIPLFIKICGINILYGSGIYYSMKDKMTDSTIERFKNFKKFIFDLFSMFGNSNLIINESMIITFSLCGKFILLPDSFDDFHSYMQQIINCDNNSRFLIPSLSFLLFSYPSSLYLIHENLYKELLKFEKEGTINLHELFVNSLLFIKLEIRFARKIMNIEYIQKIGPYIESLFKYMNHLLEDESIPLIKTEEILSYLFTIETSNPIFSLLIEKELIGISENFFNRIKKIDGVIENDRQFYLNNKDFHDQRISKVTKVIESEHPYNLNPPDKDRIISEGSGYQKNEIIEDIGVVDFGTEADAIYVKFDRRTKLHVQDYFSFYIQNDRYNPTIIPGSDHFSYYQLLKYKTNKIRITLSRRKKKNYQSMSPLWGYKMTFIGVTFDNPYYWLSNVHLSFYNNFISYLTMNHCNAIHSTDLEDDQKEFDFILKENIVQGIKLEDIDNYEQNLNNEKNVQKSKEKSNKPIKRTLTRGISRGINYDTDNDATYDDQFKKSFIKDLITVNDESKTLGKQLLDILYAKTAKQNRIRLNKNNMSILENEHYLAACLFKQLGLINVCIKFIKNVKVDDNKNYDGIEIPTRLQTLWKNIYSLRKTLFFEYQKSKSITKTSEKNQKLTFPEYSEEIKRKCKLLLYSDPILKFKTNGNFSNKTIEETTKSIMKFVTSKTPISAISELIDIKRKKLSISSQSLSLMKSFIEKKLLFESSKSIFAYSYKSNYTYIEQFQGVTYHELDDFKKLFGSLSLLIIKEIFNDPTNSIILCSNFLKPAVFLSEDSDSMINIAKFFIEVIEKNKKNDSFIRDRINILLILAIFGVSGKTHNSELVDYLLSLLLSEEIDLKSKELILTIVPLFIQIIPENKKLFDKSFAFSILSKYVKYPIIIRSAFYWIASIFNNQKCRLSIGLSQISSENEYLKMSSEEFVIKVLKGIGQSFCGKSCLFIDDSFQSFAHRQVSEGMIHFIRLLVNVKNSSVLRVIDDILIKTIIKIKTKLSDLSEEELMLSIGLFVSLSQNLSAIEPERYISRECDHDYMRVILGYDPTFNEIGIQNCRYRSKYTKYGFYTSLVSFNPKKLDLNEKEIGIILQLHNVILHSKYFVEKQNYENEEITQKEIEENILITSFYTFLPMIMQNKNNAKILLNNENINRSLSLFELATNQIPSNDNLVLFLSHFLEQAIFSPLYQSRTKEEIKITDNKGGFRLMKLSNGEISYNDDEKDIIKADPDRTCLFICTRPFEYSCKSYFEAKINKIGMKRMFLGFVDSEAFSLNEAFGFGAIGYDDIFCRKSPFLTNKIIFVGDKIMINEQNPKDEKDEDEDSETSESKEDENKEKESENSEEEHENEENESENQKDESENKKEEHENEKEEHESEKEDDENKEDENKKDESGNKENELENKDDESSNAFSINEGDTIGCYYTPDYCYLVINKKIIPYRLSHESLKSYVPLIYFDHDDIELEITQNLTIIDESNDDFNFLIVDNLPPDYFKEKDIKKAVKAEIYSYNNGAVKEKEFFIGQQVMISKIFPSEEESRIETIEACPKTLLRYRENHGIIKDIRPLNNSTFVSHVKLESYNNFTLSKEMIEFEVDSRYLKKIDTTFLNLIENKTQTKFGFNSSLNLNDLPQNLRNSNDFNGIRRFLKNKTIKVNSKSLSIIMCRHLCFILVDYLRYSKSTLLQDEGIDSKEMDVIIKSLSYSIPTITMFKPKIFNTVNFEKENKYLVFQDDVSENEEEKSHEKNDFSLPIGYGKLFSLSFLLFLKKSEKFISKHFISKLLQSMYEIAKNEKVIPIEELYEMIPSIYKIESISPLPPKFKFITQIEDDIFNKRFYAGFVPILVSSIPEQFPSAKIDDRRLRQSSNEISYFIPMKEFYDLKLKWKANVKKDKS